MDYYNTQIKRREHPLHTFKSWLVSWFKPEATMEEKLDSRKFALHVDGFLMADFIFSMKQLLTDQGFDPKDILYEYGGFYLVHHEDTKDETPYSNKEKLKWIEEVLFQPILEIFVQRLLLEGKKDDQIDRMLGFSAMTDRDSKSKTQK